jgi:HlyD family secretion protein
MRSKWNLIQLVIILFAILATSCSHKPAYQAQGYVEGRYTYIATSVSGQLQQLLVERGARVKRGDFLFVLEDRPESDLYRAAVDNLKQSIATRNATAANLDYAKITYERYKVLVPKNAISQSQLDNAKSIYVSTQAQLAQANANIASTSATLSQTQWNKDQKMINAPIDAIVFDTYYRPGEYTTANNAILSLLAPADIKVIFYINEAVLSKIKLGDAVSVRCDTCNKSYPGKISFISPSAEYTPPVIYSNDTNEKLIYRIEAEFKPEYAYNMHPGQPLSVTYYPHD